FPGEWDLKDTVFPHAHRGKPPDPAYYENLRRTPFADELLLEAALEAMKAHDLGTHSSPDVFTVSFAAGGGIGHNYRPLRHEAIDNYLRLDLLLDRPFTTVET